MPKYLEEARKMAAKMVEDGDDGDREMAKKMMALFGDGEKPKEEAKAEKEAPPPKKPEAKAEAEEEQKAKAEYGEGEKDPEKMKAAAAASTLDFVRELHEIKAERAAEKLHAERAKLLATRPDFDAKTRAWLEDAPLATVKNAVANFPRIPVNPAAASQTAGTRGESQGVASAEELEELNRPPSMTDWIKQKMGRSPEPKAGIVHAGKDLVFMPMTQAQAQAALAKKGQ